MKIILWIICFLFLFKLGVGQNLMPIGAKWYYGILESYVEAPLGCMIWEVEKDTLVKDKVCRLVRKTRIYSNGDTIFMPNQLHPTNYELFYVDGNKIYHYLNSNFYLLYDFEAEVGETWEIRIPFSFSGDPSDTIRTVTVESVSKEEVGGIPLVHLNLSTKCEVNPDWSFMWTFQNPVIQCIGGTYFLPFPWSFSDAEIPYLRCYFNENNIPLIESDYPCDTISAGVGIPDNFNSKTIIDVHPNPFEDIITFKSEESGSYQLTNIAGLELKNGKIVTGSNILDLNDLPHGLYVVHFSNNKNYQTIKLIKN